MNIDNSTTSGFFPCFQKRTRDKDSPTHTTCVCEYYSSMSGRQARVETEWVLEAEITGVQCCHCSVQAISPGCFPHV